MNSSEFKLGTEVKQREMIGNIIFDYIEKAIGQMRAPKLTGMIVDLPLTEMYESIPSLPVLENKARIALEMLIIAEFEDAQKEKALALAAAEAK